ncbi:hypothetical protein BK826_04175 [Rothia kristinae]|uniref:TIGR01906 family membrane protein n=1 Tax=Rothia kristinae TaxID=37923 RepID=A0A1S2N369_9MICC|nr:DUF1461 domain-containing protein [Rothia kristinae]OIJ36249.1 hypothetical protein BK826_04175 [Rothia kristinae]
MSPRSNPEEQGAPWSSATQEWDALAPAVDAGTRGGSTAASAPRQEPGPLRESAGGRESTAQREPAARQEPAARPVRTRPRALRLRQAVIAVAVPLVILMAAIRAVATPAFLWFEYHRPGFPADAYGFSTEDRMVYGSHGLDYILNFAPARFLGDVMLPDGRHAFTAPEVGHMTDVKHVMLWSLLLVGCWLVLAVLCARRLGDGAPGALRRALFAGAWLTILLILGLLGLSLLGWERFFTGFHEIFFPEGNWAFYPSDTLIRLYPDQFWVDSAVLIALITVLAVSVLLVATWPLAHRRQRDLARAHARQEANRQAGTRRQAVRGGSDGTTRDDAAGAQPRSDRGRDTSAGSTSSRH